MTALDPRTPVLVGAAAVQQHEDDTGDAQEAAVLMEQAVRAAASDSGGAALLDAVDLVLVPEGTWSYPDPGRLVGAPATARTVLAAIGVLQQSLFTRACLDLAAGRSQVALVCGAEAKYRALRGVITGTEAPEVDQGDARPDERLAPADDILSPTEIGRELAWPVRQYALMESALRAAEGQSIAEHADALHGLWSRFSAVAAGNPDAWTRTAYAPGELVASEGNPMLASPYTKRHASQWNVDQAAALLLCTVEAAERLGIARDRWVFPLAAAESNHMVALTERAELHRSPAMAISGARVAELAAVDLGTVEHLDLYSCFPAAVRMQARELGIDEQRQLTVTGGMTFAGGPLNNYALQALVAMVGELRADPSATGLTSSVSGMITKYGLGLWSCTPAASGFRAADVSVEVAARTPSAAVDPDHTGPASVAACTVAHERGVPAIGIVVADTPAGDRAVALTRDPTAAAALATGEWHGVEVTVRGADLEL